MKAKALVAEFIGVFGLCFLGILAIAMAGDGHTNLTGVALAHGLGIMFLVATFAAVSGAHFNPAVSFGLLLGGKIDGGTFAGYVVAQLLGGAVGAFAAGAVFGAEAIGAGTPAVAAGVTAAGATIAEVVGTFFLVTVVYGVAVSKKSPGTAPIYIGLTIVACILAFGPVSGCAINPARYLGPALLGGVLGPDAWIWIVGPLLGGGLAGVLSSQFFLKGEEEETA